MNPVTLNDICADVNVPVTEKVLELTVPQVPMKSTNELHEMDWMVKLLAKVTRSYEGITPEFDGLKLIVRDVAYPYVAGLN